MESKSLNRKSLMFWTVTTVLFILQPLVEAQNKTEPDPTTQAIYSHWFNQSFYPATKNVVIPSCGQICHKNSMCLTEEYFQKAAEVKCSGQEWNRMRLNVSYATQQYGYVLNSRSSSSISTDLIMLTCQCQRSTIKRTPGIFCGPLGLRCRPYNSESAIDGENTMIAKSQGSNFLEILANRTRLALNAAGKSILSSMDN